MDSCAWAARCSGVSCTLGISSLGIDKPAHLRDSPVLNHNSLAGKKSSRDLESSGLGRPPSKPPSCKCCFELGSHVA